MKHIIDHTQLEGLVERIVHINRVAKVVKGGRRFGFSARVVVGDGQGHVGVGLGKANEVPDAIRKANDQAKKSLIKVPLFGTTVPHTITGRFGAANVLLKPASPGTGVIAGGAVRAVLESAGIKDVLSKIIGTSNAHNVVHATMHALSNVESIEQIASRRGKPVEELAAQRPNMGMKVTKPVAKVAAEPSAPAATSV